MKRLIITLQNYLAPTYHAGDTVFYTCDPHDERQASKLDGGKPGRIHASGQRPDGVFCYWVTDGSAVFMIEPRHIRKVSRVATRSPGVRANRQVDRGTASGTSTGVREA